MRITRTGECPIFLKYITEQALIPRTGAPSNEFLELTRFNFHWIDIPSYQRGLVWDEDLLESLFASRSVFLGNAILGSFPVPSGASGFTLLPPGVGRYEVLIDGLQRFSIGTAVLNILFPLVLCDTPTRGAEAGLFAPLKLQTKTWAPVFQHNDVEMKSHPRWAVADSYSVFYGRLQTWVNARFDRNEAKSLSEEVIQLFLQRQIAPDIYNGFSNVYEVAGTFIGLNTVRVQLNIVDWLRSVIIDKGGESKWTPEEIEDLENRFSEIFNSESGEGPESELIPLASILKEILTEGSDQEKKRVFPSWGSSLMAQEVIDLLNFVETIWDYDSNPYVRELRLCGAIPFAAVILYFYRRKLLEGYEPAFLKGGDADDAALLKFLRAYYRVVFEGRVARTREFAKRLLLTEATLEDIGEQISKGFIKKSLDEKVDGDWLAAALKAGDQKRAKQFFNACLLPEHGSDIGFHPHRYGRNTTDYQIDHMIPASILVGPEKHKPGAPEVHLLMNFAPIRKTTNVKQLNIQCSHKLATNGVYQMECANNEETHPYIRWLVEHQGALGSKLDQKELLQTAAPDSVATDRINWLTERLLARL